MSETAPPHVSSCANRCFFSRRAFVCASSGAKTFFCANTSSSSASVDSINRRATDDKSNGAASSEKHNLLKRADLRVTPFPFPFPAAPNGPAVYISLFAAFLSMARCSISDFLFFTYFRLTLVISLIL
jgi:hypothetical protein